jgi:NADP-dependent 3-hydroxy acid dehydrogenase YdfG
MELDSILAYSEESLRGKRALVTGASSGFGLAIATRLAAEGCHLVLVARRQSRLDELKTELQRRFSDLKIETIAGDVRSSELFEAMHRQGAFDVDILINNAGLARGLDPIQTANLDHWNEMVDTNVKAAFRMVHETLPKMLARGSGHIVNMASISGHETYDKGSVYCATKHALVAFTKALRLEVYDKNIRVSMVSPGLAQTEFSVVRFSGDAEQASTVYNGLTPLSAADIAHQTLFCLKQPRHVNISEILVYPTAQGSATRVYRSP